jgi:4-diphosphocytidyl-2-C-methyl-D-erythritol kinase
LSPLSHARHLWGRTHRSVTWPNGSGFAITMNTLVITAPAKINLFLKVTGRRPNGYHDLFSLLCRISLFDTVTLSFDRPSITVRCFHPRVPEGKANLAYKAATLFFRALSRKEGVDICIDKAIPVGAGLGGGSSNAAAVLTGLNQYYGFPFNQKQLMAMGLALGADVPFFILGKTALARGIGEDLEIIEGMPSLSVVLIYPKLQVSTAWVYKHLNLGLTICEENYNVSWFLEDLSRIKDFLCNDLEQVTAEAFPEILVVKRALLDVGALGALMSGSGSAVFGVFRNKGQAAESFQKLKCQKKWETFLVESLVP